MNPPEIVTYLLNDGKGVGDKVHIKTRAGLKSPFLQQTIAKPVYGKYGSSIEFPECVGEDLNGVSVAAKLEDDMLHHRILTLDRTRGQCLSGLAEPFSDPHPQFFGSGIGEGHHQDLFHPQPFFKKQP